MTSPTPRFIHPSFLELDRFFLGVPSGPATRSHLEACSRCREHLHTLARERVAALSAVVSESPPPAARSRHRPLRWSSVGPAAALAAAAVLVLARPHPDHESRAARLATKGGPMALVLAERERRVRPLSDGDVVQAGDRLRLRVDGGGFSSLTVFTPRASGELERLYVGPLTATEGAVLLPVAWRVDERGDAEILLVVFAGGEVTAAEVPDLLASPRTDQHWTTVLRFPKPGPAPDRP